MTDLRKTGKPVAWIEKDKDYLAVSADPFENAIPVYTAPPKREWVELTDEDFYGQSEVQVMAMKYAEAKLKEKNA